MSSDRLATLLYWLMLAAGGALLVPCLVLPAWLEYRATLDLYARRRLAVERHQAAVERIREQRKQLETDDAYLLRLARRELNYEIPGVTRIEVEPAELPASSDPPLPELKPRHEEELAPELSALVEQLMVKYPAAQIFARNETRPPLMIMGGGLIVTAVLLLGRSGAHRRTDDPTLRQSDAQSKPRP